MDNYILSYTVSIIPFRRFSFSSLPLINDVSSERCLIISLAVVVGIDSLGSDNPFEESTRRDGVCDLEGALDEQRDDGLEFKFSKGISSDVGLEIRGLESLDFGVPECDLVLLPSLFGVLIGALPGFAEELR